jgi:hypothetical protein
MFEHLAAEYRGPQAFDLRRQNRIEPYSETSVAIRWIRVDRSSHVDKRSVELSPRR